MKHRDRKLHLLVGCSRDGPEVACGERDPIAVTPDARYVECKRCLARAGLPPR